MSYEGAEVRQVLAVRSSRWWWGYGKTKGTGVNYAFKRKISAGEVFMLPLYYHFEKEIE